MSYVFGGSCQLGWRLVGRRESTRYYSSNYWINFML